MAPIRARGLLAMALAMAQATAQVAAQGMAGSAAAAGGPGGGSGGVASQFTVRLTATAGVTWRLACRLDGAEPALFRGQGDRTLNFAGGTLACTLTQESGTGLIRLVAETDRGSRSQIVTGGAGSTSTIRLG